MVNNIPYESFLSVDEPYAIAKDEVEDEVTSPRRFGKMEIWETPTCPFLVLVPCRSPPWMRVELWIVPDRGHIKVTAPPLPPTALVDTEGGLLVETSREVTLRGRQPVLVFVGLVAAVIALASEVESMVGATNSDVIFKKMCGEIGPLQK
jgi:hypothetical protein